MKKRKRKESGRSNRERIFPKRNPFIVEGWFGDESLLLWGFEKGWGENEHGFLENNLSTLIEHIIFVRERRIGKSR